MRALTEEEGRAAREDLTPILTRAQAVQVKKIAHDLLARLQERLSVFQWRQRQQTRSDVRWTVAQVPNDPPDEPYPKNLWDASVEATWQFVLSRPDAPALHARLQ